jgi:hypothetical protein
MNEHARINTISLFARAKLRLEKGVYLAHVKASYLGARTSGILEFHVDPPEQPLQLHLILSFVFAIAFGVAVSAWYVDHRKLSRKLLGIH